LAGAFELGRARLWLRTNLRLRRLPTVRLRHQLLRRLLRLPAYSYGYYDYAGSGTTTGLFLGALAGGIIGNNSRAFHHDAWLGALWGAGVGSAIGNAVETNRSAIVYAQPTIAPASTAIATQAPAAAAQPATIINNYYGTATPMAAANSLFGR